MCLSRISNLLFVPEFPFRIPLIISWCVMRNSLPGNIRVAMTAAFECVWITARAPAKGMTIYFKYSTKHEQHCWRIPLIRYAFMKRGVHWLFLKFFCGGGKLMSFSSRSHTNKSSGYKWEKNDDLWLFLMTDYQTVKLTTDKVLPVSSPSAHQREQYKCVHWGKKWLL